jgi:thioredoxin reductase (NADPH)
LIHRGGEISRSVKYWIKPNIENRIKCGEVKAYFHSHVLAIRPDSLQLATPDGNIWIKNDFVFAMTGYHPDLEFLTALGIHLSKDNRPRTDPETLESERAGVYLAGVIVAGMHTNEIFIENGRFHGKKIADAIRANLR